MTEMEFEEITARLKLYWPQSRDFQSEQVLNLWWRKLQWWLKDDVLLAIDEAKVDHSYAPPIKVILAKLFAASCEKDPDKVLPQQTSESGTIVNDYRQRYPERVAGMTDHEIIKMHDRTSRLMRFAKLVGMRGKEGKFITEGEILEDFGKHEQKIRGWWDGLTEDIQGKLRQVVGD